MTRSSSRWCFHPLYRGTWYLTVLCVLLSRATTRFHPLYRGTWYLTSARSTNLIIQMPLFPSAISRYLVSDITSGSITSRLSCFHPLYRGTWFPTQAKEPAAAPKPEVSIRYIAVLGFQLGQLTWVNGQVLVSIRYIAVLGFQPPTS